MPKQDRTITFTVPFHDDDAMRRLGFVKVPIAAIEKDPGEALEELVLQAIETCFGPEKLWWSAAYDLLRSQIARLNRDRAFAIKTPFSRQFYDRLLSDERSLTCPWIWTPQKPARSPRDIAKDKRRRELWYDACELFIDMRSAGMSIDGEFPSLSNRSLQRIIPALNRAVGGEREGIQPPSARWFRSKVGYLMRSEAD